MSASRVQAALLPLLHPILEQYRAGQLDEQRALELLQDLRHRLPAKSAPLVLAADHSQARHWQAEQQILQTILQHMGQLLEQAPQADWSTRQFAALGLHSLLLTALSSGLSQALARPILPDLLFSHPNPQALARHLAQSEPTGASAACAPPLNTNLQTNLQVAPQADLHSDPVVICGIGARLPGADNLHQFWQALATNQDLVQEVPATRWDWRQYDSDPAQTRARFGAFIQDVACFDAAFFNISPREAELMDPQHRILLEAVWHALEDAALDPASLRGSDTALYVGVGAFDYLQLLQEAGYALHPQMVTGNVASFLTNRISWLLDWHGPSEPVCTACSASLVALHHAQAAILRGDCEIALAGGVHLTLSPAGAVVFSRSGMLAADGKCKTFDARADGYVRGEGVGMLVLMRRSRAQRDGVPIYARLRAAAENHGGMADSLTAPNPLAQSDLLAKAYRQAAIEPESLAYIEAHGTGTKLGDPVEMAALKTVFSAWQGAEIGVGSVKTNIGHLETAAGIAGVIKVLLMLQHRQLPGNPHLQEINPFIQLEHTPLYLLRDTRPWPAPHSADGQRLPRRAGISSFGIGGSNAHLVLEEEIAAPPPVTQMQTGPQFFPLSAKDPAALQRQVQQLHDFLFVEHGLGAQPATTPTALSLSELQALCARVLNVSAHEMAQSMDLDEADALQQSFADYGMQTAQLCALHQLLQDEYGQHLSQQQVLSCYNLAELAQLAQLQQLPVQAALADKDGDTAISLPALACTLQLGRQAHPCRAGFLAASWQDLQAQMQTFLQAAPGAAVSVIPAPAVAPVIDTAPTQEQVQICLQERRWDALQAFWLQGTVPNWSLAWPEGTPRLHLPGYPFAKTEHWLQAAPSAKPTVKAAPAALHPLVQQNVSDLQQQKFVSQFSGSEYFIADHKIHTEAVLSSSAPLEMARAAASLSGFGQVTGLHNVRWQHPVLARQGQAVQVSTLLFFREQDGHQDLHFEVRGAQDICACSGRLSKHVLEPVAALAPEAIAGRCPTVLSHEECYQGFAAQDVHLGPGLRVLHSLRYNEQEALGQLQLAAHTVDPVLELHPALLDGMIQTLIRYEMAHRRWLLSVILPTEITHLQIHAPLPPQVLVHVRHTREENSAQSLPLMYYDIDVCDLQGRLLLSVRDFSVKLLAGAGQRYEFGKTVDTSAAATPKPAPAAENLSQTESALHATLHAALSARIAASFAGVLKIPAAQLEGRGRDLQMSELGVQSLILMELSEHISNALGVPVTPTVFFEYASINALTDYCLLHFRAQLSAKLLPELTSQPASESGDVSRPPRQEEGSARRFAPAPIALQAQQASEQENSPPGIPTQLHPQPQPQQIAIVGMCARLPQAPDVDSFWRHLQANADLIEEIPATRWDWRACHGSGPNQTLAKWGGFISDIDQFDYRFFNLTPREAELMDPQQRLFLQCAYGALEDAALDPSSLAGSQTGVFVGGGAMDYLEIVKEREPVLQAQMVTGNVTTFLANRVSYLLNLRGPSEPVETACSASLIAIHRAAQAITNGECDLALAGGVNFILTPGITLAFSTMGIISADGRCRVFDQAANGYVRGEGVAAVVLMPLARALRDGHPVAAIVRGSAENHGGRANSITAPSPLAQKELLQKAYTRAGVDIRTVSYLEAHGTGTALGDPVELTALRDVYRAAQQSGPSPVQETQPYCLIGSVKTNIGHLETAAGVAAVVKVLLMLRHAYIPGNPHLQQVNPLIDLRDTPCALVQQGQSWARLHDGKGNALPRRAGISSFGAGGSNAHLVLEEYLPAAPSETEAGACLVFPFSAQSAERLQAKLAQMLLWLQERPELSLAALAWTLQAGREALPVRLALVADSHGRLCELLRAHLNGTPAPASLESAWEQLAQRWQSGATVDWTAHYANRHTPPRLSLPGYPFAPTRCWVGGAMQASPSAPPPTAAPGMAPATNAAPAGGADSAPGLDLSRLRSAISQVSKLPEHDILPERSLQELGIDSVLMLGLINHLQRECKIELTLADLYDKTIAELAANLPAVQAAAPASSIATTAAPAAQAGSRSDSRCRHLPPDSAQLAAWPELQILQRGGELPPVFWSYSGFGTVQGYLPLARELGKDLPFYAFQASGLKGEKKPFRSLSEIARYHADIIAAIQPEGSLRLGGYSFGGSLAYETARCLQSRGRRVESLVMIDSFFPDRDFPSYDMRAGLILTFITFLQMNGKAVGTLYTRNVPDGQLLDYLLDLGIARGLPYTRAELAQTFEKFLTLTDEAILNGYRPLPLPDTSLACHYFGRNRHDQFMLTTPTAGFANQDFLQNMAGPELERVNRAFARQAARAWDSMLPGMVWHTTPAEDHFRMLAQEQSRAQIVATLRTLYLGSEPKPGTGQ